LTLVATFFWILDQQGGSSISLFILRNVQKSGIPTGAFQAINPLVIIIGGFLLAIFIQKKVKKVNSKTDFIKITGGVVLLIFGYLIITWSAQIASFSGKVSFWMPVIALSFIGIAEIFIDPVILSKINREIPRELLGTVTAIYYLFVGALANFLSGKVANLSVIPNNIVQSNNLKLSASIYFNLFSQITLVGVLALSLLIIIFLLNRLNSISIKTINCAFLRKP
jgi:POT family proton-dependent oligopeptide transporter